MIQIITLALLSFLLTTGCTRQHMIEVPVTDDGEWTVGNEDATPHRTQRTSGKMYTRRDEGKYVIKPEPYSIKSKKKDPELLGPQRTYKSDKPKPVTRTQRTKRKTSGMTRSSCISLIGEEKFNKYVKKYGGEKGALRRCLIIKRLRG